MVDNTTNHNNMTHSCQTLNYSTPKWGQWKSRSWLRTGIKMLQS